MAKITNMSYLSYLSYITFGLLPSVIWLVFYLRKDHHPESNKMVLKIFFYGGLSAGLAAIVEIGLLRTIKAAGWPNMAAIIVNAFLAVALIEELLKYLVVRLAVLGDGEFDEPTDAALYMIIAALGFAAIENIIILFASDPKLYLLETFSFSIFRFVSATFLHALCSGMVGYFLALSLRNGKKRFSLLFLALAIAALLHGAYNFSIISIEGSKRFIIPVVIIVALALFLSQGLKKLKRLKSVCLIK